MVGGRRFIIYCVIQQESQRKYTIVICNSSGIIGDVLLVATRGRLFKARFTTMLCMASVVK